MLKHMRTAGVALLLTSVGAAAQEAPADLIFTNARIYTVDSARPIAQALGIRDGRIMFVGSAREAETLVGVVRRPSEIETGAP